MEFIRGIHNITSRHHGCVITIGNFDGFHLGHQELIKRLRIEGNYRNLPVMVILFEPQPQEFFYKKKAPTRLTRLRDKIKYLAKAGVDKILCITFNEKFSNISADTFINDLLVKRLGVRFICIGNDFKFGFKRQGNFNLLKKIGNTLGFEVMRILNYTKEGERISSTVIRNALIRNNLIKAEKLMGHSYKISGRVIHGDALGQRIGFPTANISFKKNKIPLNGVYAVEVLGITTLPLLGVANIGTCPTVATLHQRLEIHLLDVTINLYGYYLEVVILSKVRNEKRFDSIEELKRQIENDIMLTRYFLKQNVVNKEKKNG